MIHGGASNSFCFRYIFDGEPRDRGDIKQSLIREFVTWFGSNAGDEGDHPTISKLLPTHSAEMSNFSREIFVPGFITSFRVRCWNFKNRNHHPHLRWSSQQYISQTFLTNDFLDRMRQRQKSFFLLTCKLSRLPIPSGIFQCNFITYKEIHLWLFSPIFKLKHVALCHFMFVFAWVLGGPFTMFRHVN